MAAIPLLSAGLAFEQSADSATNLGMENEEEWRAVVGWEGLYEVSSAGSIRSVERRIPLPYSGTRFVRSRILKPWATHGYPTVCLARLGETEKKKVHVAVAEAFLGSRPAGFDICHGDGNRGNPRLDNLRYATRKENHSDKRRHGTHLKGEEVPTSKLTPQDVARIRNDPRRQRDIAADYGIAQAHVSRLKNRAQWVHI
jgi:hypothetical protein